MKYQIDHKDLKAEFNICR